MATWQESNGGSFLAGIGSQNNNAPRSIDSLPTLGLIQQNNEFTRQGGNNVGLQALQGLNGLASMHQQEQQKQQQHAFQSEYAAALQSGDREQIRALLSKYPQQVQAVQDGMKWSDDDYRNTLGNLATRGEVAAKSPDSFYSWVGNNADALKKVGADPNQLVTMYQQDPAGTARLIGSVGMHAMGHEKYWDLQDKMAGREIDRGQLAETARNNDMTNARGWASNNIAQQNVNIRRLELQDKALDRQLSRETNQVQLGILQDKRATTQRELEKSKTEKTDTYNTSMDTMNRTIETANKVLNSPGFTGYFGVNLVPGTNRWVPGTDAADTGAMVDTLKSQGFMSGIQQMRGLGALSNMEGQRVMDAIGNLSHNQSEKSARAAIKTIIETTTQAQKRMQQKYGNDIPQPEQQARQSQMSDDDLVNKYLGG